MRRDGGVFGEPLQAVCEQCLACGSSGEGEEISSCGQGWFCLGQLIAKARKIRNVETYEAQINSGDPNDEAGWHPLPVQTSCAKIKIDGLTPQTKVWARLRGVNSHGSGPWTDPAGETVL